MKDLSNEEFEKLSREEMVEYLHTHKHTSRIIIGIIVTIISWYLYSLWLGYIGAIIPSIVLGLIVLGCIPMPKNYREKRKIFKDKYLKIKR